MKKYFIIFLKWIFWFIIFLFVSFLTIFFLSYLNKFEWLDKISQDFFNTRYWDKDFNSNKNAFNDYLKILNNIDKNKDNISYFDKKNCIKFKWKSNCPKMTKKDSNIVLQKKIEDYSKFIFSIRKDFYKIYKKNFIYQTPEYSTWRNKQLSFENLLKYINSLKYISTYYADNNNIRFWLTILLEYQKLIDYIINFWDLDLIQSLWVITISKINLESINYLIDNYKINNSEKKKIEKVLNKKVQYSLIENGIKREYYFFYNVLDNYTSNNIFYSKEETLLFRKAFFYEVIKNKWESKNFNKVNILLYNYPWRLLHNESVVDYSNLFNKELYLKKLREKILNKL